MSLDTGRLAGKKDMSTMRSVTTCSAGILRDYGLGDFDKVGFSLITIRNGNQHNPKYKKVYAEKLLMLKEGQHSPMHFHWKKSEDIINRGGGNSDHPFCTMTMEKGRDLRIRNVTGEFRTEGPIRSRPEPECRLQPGERHYPLAASVPRF